MAQKFGSLIFTIKDKTLDTLPFGKIHTGNQFCKFLLGVHKKSSNFASRLELGRERILHFISCQALKFIEHLNKLPATHFLKEVYEVDKSLHHEGYRCWYSFIPNSMHNLNVSETNFDCWV